VSIATRAAQAEIFKQAFSASRMGNDVIDLKDNAHEPFFAQTISAPALRQTQNLAAQTCWNAGATQLPIPFKRG